MTKDCVINSEEVGSEQMPGITDKFHRVWVAAQLSQYLHTYLLFVTATTRGAWGEKYVMWRNFSTWQIVMWNILHTTDFHVEKFLLIRNHKEKSNREIYPHNRLSFGGISPQFILFCCKICFAAVYAVLTQNLYWAQFTRFCMEKNWTKYCICGGKRKNIRCACPPPT